LPTCGSGSACPGHETGAVNKGWYSCLETLDGDLGLRTPVLRLALCAAMAFTLLVEFGRGHYAAALFCAVASVVVVFFTDESAYGPAMERLAISFPNILATAGACLVSGLTWMGLCLR